MRRSSIVLILPFLWLALTSGCGAVSAASVTVSLAPADTLALEPGGVQTFTATVTGTTNEAVTWSATCGELSGTGNVVTFTAPSEASTCTITATSVVQPTASGSVVVTVDDGPAGDVAWLRQYATAGGFVVPGDVAVDAAGRVLVTGYVRGDFAGASEGFADAFVLQLDAAGEERWLRRFGTTGNDWGSAVAAGRDGHVYVTGYAGSDFDGSNAGRVFLIRFDPDGEEVWRRQFGAADDEYGLGVVVDAVGNAFVAWTTTGELGDPNERAFVSMFGPSGDELWRSQFDERYPLGTIALHTEGRVMVTGRTDRGVVVVTLTLEGDETGRRHFDLDDVVVGAHLLADGRLYLTGATTLGTLGEFDAYVTAFHADGARAWRRQLGTASSDEGRAVAVDDTGHVLMVGATGIPVLDEDEERMDAFIVKLGPDGEELWRRRYGASEGGRDWAASAAFDPHGAAIVVGGTHGNLVQMAVEATQIGAPFSEEPFDEEPGTQMFVMKLMS